jgi:hypothetical protein
VIRIGDIFAPINGAHAGERLLVIAVTRDTNHDDQAIVATTTNSISRVRLWTANIDYFSEGDDSSRARGFFLSKIFVQDQQVQQQSRISEEAAD